MNIETNDGLCRVFLDGEIDYFWLEENRKALREVCSDAAEIVILDVSSVTFVDSAGVSIVHDLVRQCDGTDGTFFLTGASPLFLRILKILGFESSVIGDAASRSEPLDRIATIPAVRISPMYASGSTFPKVEEGLEPIPETAAALTELGNDGDSPLDQLRAMGHRVQEVVPECVGLSLALVQEGLTFTLVASSPDIALVDAAQYLDGGPCVESVRRGEVVNVNIHDLTAEQQWLIYAQASAAVGIASSLSLAILREGQTIGGVNLYASTPHAFDGHHDEVAAAVGASAADAVTNADLDFSSRRLAAEAPSQLANHDEVDRAVGLLAARQHINLATAKERLGRAAERAGISEADAAKTLTASHQRSL